MICVDELLCASATHAQARVRLSPGHILLHNGMLAESGYVELAAQTAGAMKGYLEKKRNIPVREGFLAAAQNFSFHGKALQGDVLRIAVALTARVAEISLLEASILREEGNGDSLLLARGKLKLFIPEA
jgi:predicted hotdog family 3-hydroxylacyl-ACP dehydratase